ncbi:MAG: aminomethyl-transferring glycine dehydrogenase subunit GcvPA [bacterium]
MLMKGTARKQIDSERATMKNPFISITNAEKEQMLKEIGVSGVEELFNSIPEQIRQHAEKVLSKEHPFSHPLTEQQVIEEMKRLAGLNEKASRLVCFAGAGAYSHFIPSAIDYILSRSEFITGYTPYQAEISQGTLQAIFEFQTYIAMLTGMDVANASMYDGASACAESVLMAMRITGRKRILISQALHPHYREVIKAYTQGMNVDINLIPYESDTGKTSVTALQQSSGEDIACVVVGYPNFFGVIEPIDKLFSIASEKKAMAIAVVTEAMSMGLLEPPGKLGADITAMECQSLGIPLSYGGPYIGVIATKKAFVRQLPGRLVGQTVDKEGNRAYTLTLSTREQHIRREKATSNICSNEGLLAIAVAIYLGLTGKTGFMETARINHENAVYLHNMLEQSNIAEFPFNGPFFNEFVARIKNLHNVYPKLLRDGFLPGVMLDRYYNDMHDCLLINVTETNSREEMDRFVQKINPKNAFAK